MQTRVVQNQFPTSSTKGCSAKQTNKNIIEQLKLQTQISKANIYNSVGVC